MFSSDACDLWWFFVLDPRRKEDPYLEVLFWRNIGTTTAVQGMFYLNIYTLMAQFLSQVTAGCSDRFVAAIDGTLNHIDAVWAVHDHPGGAQNGIRGFAMGV